MILKVAIVCSVATQFGSNLPVFYADSMKNARAIEKAEIADHPEIYPKGKCEAVISDVTAERAAQEQSERNRIKSKKDRRARIESECAKSEGLIKELCDEILDK